MARLEYAPGPFKKSLLAADHLRRISAANQVWLTRNQNSYKPAFPQQPGVVDTPITIHAKVLEMLSGEEFVSACYEQILRKPVDDQGLAHYLTRLYTGTPKREIIRKLAAEPEAIATCVIVVYPE
jgi:hypothetical protein